MTLYAATITLILVMDPLGNIPIYISLLKKYDPVKRTKIILRECLIAFLILVLFLFFGRAILQGLHITTPALSIAGGIILFLISIRMIFPHHAPVEPDEKFSEPFIVPLAVPMTAGPSAIATVMLFISQQPQKVWLWFWAVVVACVIFTGIVLSSSYLMRVLGERGLIAVERLMGMILTTISVQMFLGGIELFFATPQKVIALLH